MVVLIVDTDAFLEAGAEAAQGALTVDSALSRLAGGLSHLSHMAGSDPHGREWAAAYDQAAGQLASYGARLQEATATLSRNLTATGCYYDLVEMTNAGDTPTSSLPPRPTPAACPWIPSAAGGARTFPNPNPALEWIAEQIANLVGDLWPDGDTGKLDDASRVWHAFADDLDHVAATLTSASRALDGVDTPELPRVHDTISRIRNFATDLAGAARNLGKSCNTLSGKIAYVHTQTEITLAITIAAIAATVAAALGGTVFTFGASDAIGAAAAAGETAGAVATITGFISELAATISSLVGGITATTAGLFGAADAATIIGTTAGDLTATAVLWGTAGAAENTIVTAITEPDNDLLDAATDGFISWSLGSALGTTLELGATTTKLETATTRELLSDEPTEQFLRKWSKGPGDHGPDWIWPPNHGFDGISRPNALTPGERIDRITATRPDGQLADGDFASPKGRPFPERSLPPDRLRPPFVTVTYEVLKPLPPEVLEGRVASWFDQPGGAVQYEFPDGIASYVDNGYLRIIEQRPQQ